MAFDLNKNDGSGDSNGSKNSKTKFDLSKNDTPLIAPSAKKSNALIYAMVGILIIAAGTWYFMFNKTMKSDTSALIANTEQTDSVADATANVDSASVAVNNDDTVSNEALGTGSEQAITLKNKIPVSFAKGNTSFKTINQSLVRDIINYLANNPSARLEVRGYASSDGSLEINRSISQARADAFKRYLVAKSVSEARITAVGKGIENPIASNDTESGRRKNRRVEITID